jgi:parallel beta-helix repeat protein
MDNAAGILVQNSDHPDIYNDAILGGASFQFSPALATGQVLTGFGIVSSECLGQGSDASDGVIVSYDLIAKNVNAGIWICSDGGGGHLINTSTIRNNGRGVVLRAVSNTLLDTNTISDNYQDALVLYDAATNNTIQKNIIESSQTPGAAGIRLGGFGAGLSPLQTNIYNNTIMRNDTDVVLTGARNTSLQSNVITATVGRTAILLQVGSQGATQYTQPTGTVLRLNEVVSDGQCSATSGCAIRLDQYVTSDVDAAQNNFGLPSGVDPDTVFWHKPNDPSLGFIVHDLSNLQPAALAASTAVGAPGAPALGLVGNAGASATALTGGTTTGTGGTGAPAGAGTIPTITPGGAAAATATPAAATATAAPAANTTGATTGTSPVLQSGPAGGTTSYQAGCNTVSVPSSVGASISVANFLNEFQPVSNIFSAYIYSAASQQYQGIYFSDPTIPVQVSTLVPGNVVSICVTGTVQGPP